MPEADAGDPERMVRDGLRCLQLSGAIFFRACWSAPWAYESPSVAAVRQMLAAGQDPAAVLQQLAYTLTSRLLHAPTTALREAAINGDIDLMRAAERMFPHGTPPHTTLSEALDRQLHRDRDDDADPAPQA